VAHTSDGFGHPNHGLDVAHSNRNAAADLSLPTKLSVQARDLLLVRLLERGLDLLSGVQNVLAQEVLLNGFDGIITALTAIASAITSTEARQTALLGHTTAVSGCCLRHLCIDLLPSLQTKRRIWL
jgi:hypothetical protein